MKKLIASLIMMASFSTACASESKVKIEQPDREVAQAVQVERPESLKYESKDYKHHKEFLKYIDTHDKK